MFDTAMTVLGVLMFSDICRFRGHPVRSRSSQDTEPDEPELKTRNSKIESKWDLDYPFQSSGAKEYLTNQDNEGRLFALKTRYINVSKECENSHDPKRDLDGRFWKVLRLNNPCRNRTAWT